MKAALRQRAWELGFDVCRVTSAGPLAEAADFESWLAAGRHGTMAYLARTADRRVDPRRVLAGARSVITLAVSYAAGQAAPWPASSPASGSRREDAPTGLVARYARYADYHDVLSPPLEMLTAFIHQLGGPTARSLDCVDTGPVLERALAQRAGVGFIGKHTNLISRQLGNWLLLAEIVTTVEFEPDPPESNRCGSCARCLAACPTGALIAPFQLDARRCLAYLTIEFRGSIPLALRPALGNRIFGCDDCLEACPWNRFGQGARLLHAQARPELAEPDLAALLALDEPGFRQRFAATPLARAKRRGLVRNVCVALGNVGGASVLPALERATHDPEELVAEHARWAVGQIETRLAGVTPGDGTSDGPGGGAVLPRGCKSRSC